MNVTNNAKVKLVPPTAEDMNASDSSCDDVIIVTVENVTCNPTFAAKLESKVLMQNLVSTYEVERALQSGELGCSDSIMDYRNEIEETRCLSTRINPEKGTVTHTHQRIVSKVLNWRSDDDKEEDENYKIRAPIKITDLPLYKLCDIQAAAPKKNRFSGLSRTTYLGGDGVGFKVPKLTLGLEGSYIRTMAEPRLNEMYASNDYYGGRFAKYTSELIHVEVDHNTSLFGIKFNQIPNAIQLTRQDIIPDFALDEIAKAGFRTSDPNPSNFVKVAVDGEDLYVLIDAKIFRRIAP